MTTVLTILVVIVSILLICVVLVQKSKGGGLSSSFAGNNQIMGVRRTTDFIEKTTWVLAIIILVLSVLASILSKPVANNNSKTFETTVPEQTQSADFPTDNAETPVLEVEADGAETPATPADGE